MSDNVEVGAVPTLVWRSISTAPKDGTLILVWPPTYKNTVTVARWGEGSIPRSWEIYCWYRLDCHDLHSLEFNTTHWAPLPKGLNPSDLGGGVELSDIKTSEDFALFVARLMGPDVDWDIHRRCLNSSGLVALAKAIESALSPGLK